jgi:hypothetical protein
MAPGVLVSRPTILPWARSAGPCIRREVRRMIRPTSEMSPTTATTTPKIVKNWRAGELETVSTARVSIAQPGCLALRAGECQENP